MQMEQQLEREIWHQMTLKSTWLFKKVRAQEKCTQLQNAKVNKKCWELPPWCDN